LIAAYEAPCPLRTVKLGQNAPYWSSDLAKLRKVARRAWNHRTRDPGGYRIAIREYNYARRGAERAYFKKLTNEVDGVKQVIAKIPDNSIPVFSVFFLSATGTTGINTGINTFFFQSLKIEN
jgi:hypothetical protein